MAIDSEESFVRSAAELVEGIQKLPFELQKIILGKLIYAKIKAREELGWGRILNYINYAPYCYSRTQ